MRHRGANRTRRKSQVIPHSVPPPFSLSLSLSLSVRARAHTSTVGQESTITLWSSGGSIPREEAAAVSDPAEYAVHTSSSVTSPSLSLSIERSHVVALAAPQTPPPSASARRASSDLSILPLSSTARSFTVRARGVVLATIGDERGSEEEEHSHGGPWLLRCVPKCKYMLLSSRVRRWLPIFILCLPGRWCWCWWRCVCVCVCGVYGGSGSAHGLVP